MYEMQLTVTGEYYSDENCVKGLLLALTYEKQIPKMRLLKDCAPWNMVEVVQQAVGIHEMDSSLVPCPSVLEGWALLAQENPQTDEWWQGLVSPIIADCVLSVSVAVTTASDARVALVAALAPTSALKAVYMLFKRRPTVSSYGQDDDRFYHLTGVLDGLNSTKRGIANIRRELMVRAFDCNELTRWMQSAECLKAFASPE